MTDGVTMTTALTRSVGRVLADGLSRLRDAGSPSPRLDAEVLLAHVTGRDRAWLLAHPEARVEDLDGWERAIARRAGGEPVAYVRGFKEWRSLRIRTDARALVPRPETELLAEAAIAEIAERLARDRAQIVAWEVATGAGAVATALTLRFGAALSLGRVRLIASDISPDALELAVENLAAHGSERFVDLACADLLAPAGASLPRPDVVIANLPYVPSAEVEAATGSLAHEPSLALDGGPDGLDIVRRLCAELPDRAAPGASVLLEIGAGQADAVRALAPAGASVSTMIDLGGVERIIRFGDVGLGE